MKYRFCPFLFIDNKMNNVKMNHNYSPEHEKDVAFSFFTSETHHCNYAIL